MMGCYALLSNEYRLPRHRRRHLPPEGAEMNGLCDETVKAFGAGALPLQFTISRRDHHHRQIRQIWLGPDFVVNVVTVDLIGQQNVEQNRVYRLKLTEPHQGVRSPAYNLDDCALVAQYGGHQREAVSITLKDKNTFTF